MNNQSESNESGVDSDRLYKQKLREKFTRKFSEKINEFGDNSDRSYKQTIRKKFASKFKEEISSSDDFSQSGSLISNTEENVDLNAVLKTIKAQRWKIVIGCVDLKEKMNDLDGPDKNEQIAVIQAEVGGCLDNMNRTKKVVDENISKLEKHIEQNGLSSDSYSSTSGKNHISTFPVMQHRLITYPRGSNLGSSLKYLKDAEYVVAEARMIISLLKKNGEDLNKLKSIAINVERMVKYLNDLLAETNEKLELLEKSQPAKFTKKNKKKSK